MRTWATRPSSCPGTSGNAGLTAPRRANSTLRPDSCATAPPCTTVRRMSRPTSGRVQSSAAVSRAALPPAVGWRVSPTAGGQRSQCRHFLRSVYSVAGPPSRHEVVARLPGEWLGVVVLALRLRDQLLQRRRGGHV